MAEARLLDDETIRNYLFRYKSGDLKALLNDIHKGCGSKLSKSETEQLDNHRNKYILTNFVMRIELLSDRSERLKLLTSSLSKESDELSYKDM